MKRYGGQAAMRDAAYVKALGRSRAWFYLYWLGERLGVRA